MSNNFENIPQLVKNQQDAVKTTVEAFPKATQRISAETADYSKQYFKNWTDFAEKLRGVTTFDEAIKLQTEFAKSSYESFVAQSTKMFELFTRACHQLGDSRRRICVIHRRLAESEGPTNGASSRPTG
jgi:hypothetical protein